MLRKLASLARALLRKSSTGARRSRPSSISRSRARPFVEELEARRLPTVQVDWAALGPSPQTLTSDGNVSGRVSALSFYTFNGQPAWLVGTASGGLFRGTVANVPGGRAWTPLTDSVGLAVLREDGTGAGALRVGSLAVLGQTIYVGTGEANYANHY